ncbi:MAG: DUF222 domain-containing protein [Gammaproteobacteria bacterium]|nr:DUF222 domain-containing protein [Gammaproteobacteria bacterium]
MSVPTEEIAQHVDFTPDPAAESLILGADRNSLDFIPDDPAELRRAVTDMAARINLADWRFVKLIAAMARTRSWREGGYCNLGNWLDHQCGLGPCAARERIRIGRALERLPLIDAAFRDGVISYSKVRAITRVATPHTDAMLLAIAEGSSAAQLESLVRTYERVGGSRRGRASSEQRRSLTWHYEDGMLVITAAVPAERGALVINALQQVVDGRRDEGEARDGAWLAAMGQKGTAGPAADDGSEEAPVEGAVATDDKELPAQSEWTTDVPTDVSAETPANNVVRDNGGEDSPQIESATLTDADVSGDVSAETDGLPNWLTFALSSREQRYADALVDMAEHCLATRAGAWKRRRTGRRYEVVLTIGRNELAKQRAAGGARYHVERDWGVDQEDARHIACDADLTEYIQDAKGDLLNYERRSRIVPARLLRALKLRDQNRCRFPGCAHQRYVEAHHVRHWIDGGETCLENLVLLCSAHHRLLHHGAYHIVMEDGDVVFVGRNGEVMPPALSPQFPGVSAELPPAPIGHDAADCPLPTRRSDVLETHSDREVVDMLRHRQDWGRQKNARFQKELMKLAERTW